MVSIAITIGALVLGYFLLGLVALFVLHSMYISIEDGNYNVILPIAVGWLIAMLTYLSPDNELAISIIAGIAVYMAFTHYQRAT
ncbi:hypothetical protein [Halocatena salina]|uniref:Uncharacterized protein n=1 Tax=Halocatena salina TaxID=2934340 RepID=A0A8T9ZYJ9_9EURY|nr:hypothetical protein [Halocatena salina]UPM41724.1 hypothetical protein MW046_06915 [Halocatena salina]